MKRFKSKKISLIFAAFCLSGVLLTFIQVPFKGSILAWVALVPFILICGKDTSPWRLAWISYLVGLCYWLGNLYWIAIVTVPAYVVLSLYLGLYWPVLALCVRYVRSKPLWLLLAIPIFFTGAEAMQGYLFTGFSWRLLAHSQYANTRLIQIADIFGTAGVSFLIAMVNGLIAELVLAGRTSRLFGTRSLIKIGIVVLILVATTVYGQWRINQADEFIKPGPLAGSVQPNVPSHVKESIESGEEILAGLIKRGNACIDAGAKLVAWPETMVLTTLNHGYLAFCSPDSTPRLFDKTIREHTKNRAYVLLGAHAARIELEGSEYVVADKFNSAFLYRPDGTQDAGRYDKIHLIPFGEFIPLKQTRPWFYNIIINLSPYDYDYSLTAGDEYTVFEMPDDGKTYRFAVLICYEDTDAGLTRTITVDRQGRKKVDWLVNISNDGWYVRFKDGKVLPSAELSQRTAISVFRAVENRISILRSVNTGISCMIDPLGRLQDGFIEGDLPSRAMARQGVAGWFVDRIRIDSRVSFFSKYGQWLDFCCSAGVFIVIICASAEAVKKRRHAKNNKTKD